MLLSHVLSLEGRERRGRRGIKISSGSETGDFEGLIRIEVGQETAPSVGGGTYCIRSTCIWILLSSLFASLEKRAGAEGGESRSPLGAEQGTLRECFGLRWAKRRQLPLSVEEGRIAIRLMCPRTLITSLFTDPIRGECDTYYCPSTLSDD